VSGPADERMNELRELFFESAAELVEKLNEEALRLEKYPTEKETERSLRRIVHTLKGDAAACGFRELSELAHQLEDVFALENQAANIPEMALRAADAFSGLLDAYQRKTKLPSLEALQDEISRLARPGRKAEAPGKKKTRKAKDASPWTEYERAAMVRAAEAEKRLHEVVVQLDPQCGMPIAARQMIRIALESMGEVLALYPGEGTTGPMERIQAVLASEEPAEAIRAKCRIPAVSQSVKVVPLRLPARPVAEMPEHAADGESGDQAVPDHPEESSASKAPSAAETPAPTANLAENILRVDAERIDSVLNLVGELILAKSMMQRTLAEFAERFPKESLRGKFSDAMAFQARVLGDLQRSVMKIRMVPVEQLFRRFPRIVRDVARQCQKEVELETQGGQTDLDKTILDAVAEPLMHLLRNAVGHGIETPAERARLGKRPQGLLRLLAYHQGNQVVIEVSDDGRGIAAGTVRDRAIARRMIQPAEASRLSDAETLQMIFRPGFSTVEQVTELSGRGIGLDVVESVLARLKGSVQIETVAGRGTTFRMRLPLTLAILRAILFRVGERLYALPLNAVSEIARATEAQIHPVEHYEVLQLRDNVLPLLRLSAGPREGRATAGQKIFVLVVHDGERKFGLIVNQLAGEEELVIKGLDDKTIKSALVSGASILGDGRVVLILNLMALADSFKQASAKPNLATCGLPGDGELIAETPAPQALGASGGTS